MGNAKSTCKVTNEARYDIKVDVFGADDVGLNFAKQQLRLHPGEQGTVQAPKKGVQLVIAGNGRVQAPILVRPGETINVQKVHRGDAAPHADGGKPEAAAVREESKAESPSRVARKRSASIQQRPDDWLDEKDKYTKDELQQLLVKLRKEAARDKVAKHAAGAQAAGRGEEPTIERDELDARIAALHQRVVQEDPATLREKKQQLQEEPPAPLNTDASTDELMAAINRLSSARYHAKKPSWDMSQPHLVAQI